MSHIASITTELMTLIVQNDFSRAEADEHDLRAAREAAERARNREVEAMHRAADAIETQAWVQGAFAAGGGLLQCTEPLGQSIVRDDKMKDELKAIGEGGEALTSVAQPLGAWAGGVPKAHADADARQARGEAESADSRAEEAMQHRNRVERHTDSVLELVEGTIDMEHQGNFAILSNF